MKQLCTHIVLKNIIRSLVTCVLLYGSLATAGELSGKPTTLDLKFDEPMLALNDVAAASVFAASESPVDFGVDSKQKFEEPLFTGNKFHKYFGIGALAAVGLAIIAPKEEDGLHEYAAKTAAVLGGAAATSGLIYHWDDFHFEDGMGDPDNLHFLLGTLGTIGMFYAAAKGPEAPHAGVGALAGISMGIAVKITW